MRKVICALFAFSAIYVPAFAQPSVGGMLAMPSGQATATRHRAEMLVEQKAAEEAALNRVVRSYACTHQKTFAAAPAARTASTQKLMSTCY